MSTDAKTMPLHVLQLTIRDYLCVQCESIDAEGRHVVITGPNGHGKTARLDAIWAALKGCSAKETPEPIRHGADRAEITLDLGEYKIRRTFSPGGSKLDLLAGDGSRVGRPQQLLDGFLSEYCLDPVAFLGRRPQDQLDDVLAVCGVAPPADLVHELTGEKTPPLPGESADAYLQRLSGDQTGLYYVRRREAHRAWDQKRKALDEQREVVRQLGGPPKAKEAVSASELLGQIEALQQKADQRRAVQRQAELSQSEVEGVAERLDARERQLAESRARVANLERQLAEARVEAEDLAGRVERGREALKEARLKADADRDAAQKLPDPAPKIATLRGQVQSIEETARTVARRHAAAEQQERLAKEAELAGQEHARLDRVLEGLRHARAHLLDDVNLGVPGLTAGDGELRYRGVPLRQASNAEGMEVALAVAMRQRPRLRLLRIDDGEHMDAETRARVLARADQAGYQVFLTRVSDDRELKVEIVEG